MTLQTDQTPVDDNTENLSESFYAKNGESIANDDLSGINYSDIENLLNLAEEIEKSRDSYSDQLDSLYFWRDILFIIFLLLSIILLIMVIGVAFPLYYGIAIISIFYFVSILLLGVGFNSRIKKIKRKLRADQYALEDAVDSLREIQPILHYTNKNSQSTAKKIEFEIRLSRFKIGQKYEEPTSILYDILKK